MCTRWWEGGILLKEGGGVKLDEEGCGRLQRGWAKGKVVGVGGGGRRKGRRTVKESWKGVFNLHGIDDNTLSCPSNTSTQHMAYTGK